MSKNQREHLIRALSGTLDAGCMEALDYWIQTRKEDPTNGEIAAFIEGYEACQGI